MLGGLFEPVIHKELYRVELQKEEAEARGLVHQATNQRNNQRSSLVHNLFAMSLYSITVCFIISPNPPRYAIFHFTPTPEFPGIMICKVIYAIRL